ncbi:MAG: hypothetical protein ACK5HY_00535 [Parahaliea sp.]
MTQRGPQMDVTNSVDVTSPPAVSAAIREILEARYSGQGFTIIDTLVNDLERLYKGDFPGFHACDVHYHKLQHVLDVSLAMARLIDGYEHSAAPQRQLGPDYALAGMCAALFHDAGYIRRRSDTRHRNGAAYTRIHVRRSARWLREYLPGVGLGELADEAANMVHFTNCSRPPANVPAGDVRERRTGELLGTADLIAQLADVRYVEKCQTSLYDEFVEGGVAGANAEGYRGKIYRNADDLLTSTPGFMRWAIRERLEAGFHHAYRYAAVHFGGANLYMDAIDLNYAHLEAQLNGQAVT